MEEHEIKQLYITDLMKKLMGDLFGDHQIDEETLVGILYELCQELYITYPDKDINIERKKQSLRNLNLYLQNMGLS